jgi:hypothetical protein
VAYLIFCTFDLKNASSLDYQHAYADLAEIGLEKVQKSNAGKSVVIPTTSVMGKFIGNSEASLRDTISERVRAAFAKRGFKSEIFLVVSGNWAWGSKTT